MNEPFRGPAIVGNHDRGAVFVQHMHGDPVEQVAVLAKHKRFRPFADERRLRQHEHVLDLLDGNGQADAVARTESPNQPFLPILVVRLPLIFERQEKTQTCGSPCRSDSRHAEFAVLWAAAASRLLHSLQTSTSIGNCSLAARWMSGMSFLKPRPSISSAR